MEAGVGGEAYWMITGGGSRWMIWMGGWWIIGGELESGGAG